MIKTANIRINIEKLRAFDYNLDKFFKPKRVIITENTITELRRSIEDYNKFQIILDIKSIEITEKNKFIDIIISIKEDKFNEVIEFIKKSNQKYSPNNIMTKGLITTTQLRKNSDFTKTIIDVKSIIIKD